MERIAVFADLHGNPYACEAVLNAIRRQGALDAIVAAGDLFLGGSDPARCFELLQTAGALGVYGNTETYLLRPEELPHDQAHLKQWDEIQPAAHWVREKLSMDAMTWIEGLPFELQFKPTDNPADAALVVHANPQNIELMIYPPPDQQKALWDRVRQTDEDPNLASVFRGVEARTVIFGHFHYTFVRSWRGFTLVDVGPCSLPGYDHDPRARFTVLEWDGTTWQTEQHWVAYDYEQELAALRTSGLPFAGKYIDYFFGGR